MTDPKQIRALAVTEFNCPRCGVKPGEKCERGATKDIVCCERYTKAKRKAARLR